MTNLELKLREYGGKYARQWTTVLLKEWKVVLRSEGKQCGHCRPASMQGSIERFGIKQP